MDHQGTSFFGNAMTPVKLKNQKIITRQRATEEKMRAVCQRLKSPIHLLRARVRAAERMRLDRKRHLGIDIGWKEWKSFLRRRVYERMILYVVVVRI